MPNIRICTLDGSNLPVQFKYKPGIPIPRMKATPVAGGVILQHAVDATPDSPREIEFSCEAAIPSEFNTIFAIYNQATPSVVVFTGYSEESVDVVITEFSFDKLRTGLVDYTGKFTVLAVNDEIFTQCFSETPVVTQTL